VKLITESRTNNNLDGVLLLVNGIEGDVFNPLDGGITFRLPGVWTPDQIGGEYSEFNWNGLNDNGQNIGQGVYYIKISVKDEYGHVQTTIKETTLLRTEEYVRVSIYNSAGELVKRMEEPKAPDTVINLGNMEEVLYVGKDTDILINYGSGAMSWDGKNEFGRNVSSGIYEMQVEIKTGDGYSVVAAKTVTILTEANGSVITDPDNPGAYPKVYPNPVIITDTMDVQAVIEWFAPVDGTVVIRIYNIAGEMVRQFRVQNPAERSLLWNLKGPGGSPVSSGTYVVVVEGLKKSGEREVKPVKMVIIRKFSVDSNNVN